MRLILVGIGLIAAPLLECARMQAHDIVGAVDVDPQKIGRDLGEILSTGPLGVDVAGSIDDISSEAEVAIVATGSSLASSTPVLRACIERGLNVVSTCEELAYPWRKSPELASGLDREARSRNVTIVGAGINPGFVLDTLILCASAPCWRVRSVRARRTLDASSRRVSFRDKVGVGVTPEAFERASSAGGFGHAGLAESAWLVADRLGLGAEEEEAKLEPVLDDGGMVAGTRQVVTLTAAGREVVRLEMVMAAGLTEPEDTIELDADPPLRLTIEGGIPGDAGTAGVVLNAARRVTGAEPGLHTVDELPVLYSLAG
jgi:hypothetical protein